MPVSLLRTTSIHSSFAVISKLASTAPQSEASLQQPEPVPAQRHSVKLKMAVQSSSPFLCYHHPMGCFTTGHIRHLHVLTLKDNLAKYNMIRS